MAYYFASSDEFRERYMELGTRSVEFSAMDCSAEPEGEARALCALQRLRSESKFIYRWVKYDEGSRCVLGEFRTTPPVFVPAAKCLNLK